jgi:dTDP-glucose 4,6-dehydratase
LYRIIPKTILGILNKVKIPLDGGGKSMRNFIHVDDVSFALLKLIKKGKVGETYHISSDEIISIKELVKKISKKFDKNIYDVCKISKERLGKDHIYYLNSKKLKRIGWSPSINLDTGIDRTIEWVKKILKN